MEKIALACVMLGVATTPTISAQRAQWNAIVSSQGAAVFDCMNCDENISMLISCNRGKKLREVQFMVLEQVEDLTGKPALVTVTTGKKKIEIEGTFNAPGEAGSYPIASVARIIICSNC
jgi:hypothetical protein